LEIWINSAQIDRGKVFIPSKINKKILYKKEEKILGAA
jgi:hypothetical protein